MNKHITFTTGYMLGFAKQEYGTIANLGLKYI